MNADKEKRRYLSILDATGNTPLVRLSKLAAGIESEIWLKCEHLNPSGSIKDRMAGYMLQKAAQSGELPPGGMIVENTSGNTGAAIAMVSAVRGYQCVFTMSDKMSQEKVNGLKAYGSRVVITPANVPADSPLSYYEVAKRIHQETPGSYYVNQYHNPVNSQAHYHLTGPEIWEQTEGKLDYYVAGLGTGGTFSGVARYLKEKNPLIKCVGVDTYGSMLYNYWKTGEFGEIFAYKVEGIGQDQLVENIDFSLIDDIVQVGDRESFETGRRMAREEGIFAGGSSGAAVCGALKLAQRVPKRAVMVVILPDSGNRYLSKMYNDEWMRDNQFLEPDGRMGRVGDLLSRREARHELIAADVGDSVGQVISQLKRHGISQLPVMNAGKLVGLIHEVDLLNFMLSGVGFSGSAIEPIVKDNAPRVTPESPLDDLSAVFTRTPHEAVLVAEGESVTDIITKIDLIEFLARPAENSRNGRH